MIEESSGTEKKGPEAVLHDGCKVCTAGYMTVGDDYCSSAVEYCILGMVLHIRFQLCLKFP